MKKILLSVIIPTIIFLCIIMGILKHYEDYQSQDMVYDIIRSVSCEDYFIYHEEQEERIMEVLNTNLVYNKFNFKQGCYEGCNISSFYINQFNSFQNQQKDSFKDIKFIVGGNISNLYFDTVPLWAQNKIYNDCLFSCESIKE
jgi:hypothetical protein